MKANQERDKQMKYDVWYMQPTFFINGSMGSEWMKERGALPVADALHLTHIYLKTVEAPDLEALYRMMQGEVWSPNGEARELILSKGLGHTSMSMGDIAVEHGAEKVWMVDQFGFCELEYPDGVPQDVEAAVAASMWPSQH